MTPGTALPRDLQQEIETQLSADGGEISIRNAQVAGGSSFHRSWTLHLSNGREAFLKSNSAAPQGMFQREAEGLRALAAARDAQAGLEAELMLPKVLAVGEAGHPFLLLERIATGPRPAGFSARFGRALARLHKASTRDPHAAQGYGFEHDNFLGTTPQPNPWTEDWVDFWRRHRLGFQLDLARRQGLSTGELNRLGDRVLDRLGELIGEPMGETGEPPTLIHGDLWGGNYLVSADGLPVLIDPAAYYGRREAELAMTRLFGGFDADFESGYQEVWPLEPGAEERLQLYQLYHLLNHLNLFGGGYLDSCLRLLRRFA
ncbi:MAG: fructosamine kinase family protein [Acidobacteriota bacterium]|nr:fructosamine kinase family protein [Acidobacteriota bacterium]